MTFTTRPEILGTFGVATSTHWIASAVGMSLLEKGGTVLVTADHGNAEKMKDENNRPFTAHTLNPVPLVLVSHKIKNIRLKEGVLGDIAPTMLDIMGIEKPAEMTGNSLILKN